MFGGRSGRIGKATIYLCGLIVWGSLLGSAADAHALDWGANVVGSYARTDSDTGSTATTDQQYLLYANARLTPTLNYYASARFRRLQYYLGDSTAGWLNEWNPSVSATWNAPLLRLRSDYAHRVTEDRSGFNNLTGQSVGLFAQTTWSSLPRLTGRYDWNRNNNDLDLLGINTRQRTIGGTADYTFRNSTLRYEYNDRDTRSPSTGLRQVSQRHTGRFENSLDLLRRKLTLQTSYRITGKIEREEQTGSEAVLLPVSAALGLWIVDASPEFGPLESWGVLIDGNVDSAAAPEMNLANGEIHNFGLDFGAPATFDHLFLYADTVATPLVRWAVFTSTDNLSWTLHQGYRAFPFDPVFRRYEVLLPRVTTRYVKLVQEPLPLDRPVYVTELRALIQRDAPPDPEWTADHQASVHAAFRPQRWLSFSVDGTLVRTEPGPVTVGRHQDGLAGAIHFMPDPRLEFAGHQQSYRTSYPGSSNPRTDSWLTSLSLRSRWFAGLQTMASATRQEEAYAGQPGRRLDAGNMRIEALLLPDLQTSTEIGVSRDHRESNGDLIQTRFVGEMLNAQPVDPLQLSLDYRYYWIEAKLQPVPPTRENLNLRATLQITATIVAQGEASYSRESDNSFGSWDATLSWLPFPNLTMSGGASGTDSQGEPNTLLFTFQGLCRLGNRTDLTGGYSYFDAGASERNYSNLRFGLNLRI